MSLFSLFSRAPVSTVTVGPRFFTRVPYRAVGISVQVARFTAIMELSQAFIGASCIAYGRVTQQLGIGSAHAELDRAQHLSTNTDTHRAFAVATANVLGQPPVFQFGTCQ